MDTKSYFTKTLSKLSNPHAIMLGSNMYIGNDGLIVYEENQTRKDFFRIREIFNTRKEGSFLAVDVDIKDLEGVREIKLAKSRPVAKNDFIEVECSKAKTIVYKKDKEIIIKIEQIAPDDKTLPSDGPAREILDTGELKNIIRITGNFYIGKTKVSISEEQLSVENGGTLIGNLKISQGSGDFLTLHPSGGLSF